MGRASRAEFEFSDEETRRAMNKSFQTSGGTVLSTNWGEVKSKDYEKEKEDGTLKPPEGQEMMKAQLERIVKTEGLSENVFEIVSKSLE